MDIYAVTFKVLNIAVAPFWLAMILAPKWSVTQKVTRSLWPTFAFCLPYALLNIPYYVVNMPIFARQDLGEITKLFADPHCVALAWIHFLGVDLFAGRWIFFDSRQRGYSPWLVAPFLVFCLMFGPTGVSAYLLLRFLKPPGAPLPTPYSPTPVA